MTFSLQCFASQSALMAIGYLAWCNWRFFVFPPEPDRTPEVRDFWRPWR